MTNITANSAIFTAVNEASLTREEICNISVHRANGLYEVRFESDWMRYECYVDETSGEVLGFDLAPLAEPAVYGEQLAVIA